MVDLVLPRTPPVAALLPTVVELVGADPGRWRLSRLGGQCLNESISLQQNMIDDGDLLVLTPAEVPPQPPRQRDVFELSATTSAAPSPGTPSAIPRVVFLWTVVLTAFIACAHGGALSGALGAAFGCLGSLAAVRAISPADRPASLVLCCAAIIFAAAAGFLTVPSWPSAPNALLAATAASAVAWAVTRLHHRALTLGAATASLCVPVALTTAAATAHPLPPDALGALLSVLALTALSAAPRVAVVATGLLSDLVKPEGVARAHRILTGLVLGSSSAVALGAAVVAIGGLHRCAPILDWLLAAVMLLRVTSYTDTARQWAAAYSGLCCATAAFIASVRSVPPWAPWLSLAALVAGFALLRTGPPTATMQRLMARVEIVTLVLVVPTALWVTDVYAMIRGG